MNIKKVKTAKKVGKFILRTDNHRNLIGFEYEKNIKPILDNEDGRVYLLRPPLFFDYGIVAYYLQLIKTWQNDGLFTEDKFIELKIIYPYVYELIDAFVNRINSDRVINLDSLTNQDLINLIELIKVNKVLL